MREDVMLTMPAGEEMDALVAQKIFNQPAIKLQDDTPCPYCLSEMRYCGSRSWCSDCREWRRSPYKQFSSDVLAAWDVFEWLCVQGLVQMSNGDGDSSDVDFMPYSSNMKSSHVSDDEFPLAICRAALLAVNTTEGESWHVT